MDNRFAEMLNRGAQAVTRKPDLINALVNVRVVASKNVNPVSDELQLSTGRRTQDASFTFQGQWLTANGGWRSLRFTALGIVAEEMIEKGVKEGSKLRVTGLVQSHVNVNGQIDRRPYCIIESFDVEGPVQGTTDVTK